MKENKYRQMTPPINSTLIVVQDNENRWGVIDPEENIIVPFGKYEWIDGFQNGLARVFAHSKEEGGYSVFSGMKFYGSGQRGGIINEAGQEVLSPEYNVWKFYGKNFPTIRYFKGDIGHIVRFETLNPNLIEEDDDDYDDYDVRNSNDYDMGMSDNYMLDTWDAMTDGMYGDMPDGFDGDFDFLGR